MSFGKLGSHNPYFNRWFSAIKVVNRYNLLKTSHNPYFNRWFSAMGILNNDKRTQQQVTILILIDGFLQ